MQAAVVDHRLQDGSAERAAATVALLAERGITARVHAVDVTGPGGIEAAARRARQAALRAARPIPTARSCSATPSTTRPRPCCSASAAGPARGRSRACAGGIRRGCGRCWPSGAPRLGPRARARAAAWDDPHNVDPRFTRVRLRHEVLPLLEDVLAGGVAEALARTAAQLREDADALDAVAAQLLADALRPAHTVGLAHRSRPRQPAGAARRDSPPERTPRSGLQRRGDAARLPRPRNSTSPRSPTSRPRSAAGCCAPGSRRGCDRPHGRPSARRRRPRSSRA